MNDSRGHWDAVYATKQAHEVSWTQAVPRISLDFIQGFQLPKTAPIIDIGGGDSRLADALLDDGYTNITVLDISETALQKARIRLGARADQVRWIVSDMLHFQPDTHYEVWHDRASFHFLTNTEQVDRYLAIAKKAVSRYMILGTFSENGPEKCSGLPVHQYQETTLSDRLAQGFNKIRCLTEDHITPFLTTQQFLFCSFSARAS